MDEIKSWLVKSDGKNSIITSAIRPDNALCEMEEDLYKDQIDCVIVSSYYIDPNTNEKVPLEEGESPGFVVYKDSLVRPKVVHSYTIDQDKVKQSIDNKEALSKKNEDYQYARKRGAEFIKLLSKEPLIPSQLDGIGHLLSDIMDYIVTGDDSRIRELKAQMDLIRESIPKELMNEPME